MITILIVDDRADNRSVLIAMLQHRGYRLLEAESGAQTLQLARKEMPDLIIADVLMPKMDGYELVRRLRDDPAIATIPVIFYTASYIEEESRKLARACGVEHLIVKPAEPEDVFKVIDSVLGEKKPMKPVVPPAGFVHTHLHLVTDKLAEKIDELEKVNADLENEIANRRYAERELRSTQTRLQHLFACTPAVIYSLRVAGSKTVPVFVSENIERLLGVEIADWTSSDWWLENVHPDDRNRVAETVSNVHER